MSMWFFWITIAHVALFAMIFIGIALVWSARAIYVYHGRRGWRQAIFRTLGWTLIGLFLIVVALGMLQSFVLASFQRRSFGLPAPVILGMPVAGLVSMFLLAVLGMSWHEARNAFRRVVLWTIEMAATKKLPYSLALRAVAVEYAGILGARLAQVADLLDLGVPLPVALRTFGHTTADGDLAIRVGWNTGEMERSLSAANKSDWELRQVVLAIARLVGYFSLVAMIAWYQVALVVGRHFPDIADEFEITRGDVSRLGGLQWILSQGAGLPPFTRWAIAITPFVLTTAPVIFLVAFTLHLGLWPSRWWPVSVLGIPLDRCRTLEQLAACLRSGKDINATMHILAEVYPTRLWRQRLASACKYLDAGVAWWHALVRVGVLDRHQATWLRTLQSGQQLAWGCEELARRLRNRIARRLVRLRLFVVFGVVLLSGLVVAILGSIVFELLGVIPFKVLS